MAEIFFSSDLHIDHENIIYYTGRPFANVKEMNEALIYNWNKKVSPTDMVYVLGDLKMGSRQDLSILAEFNGSIKLVPGNHDYAAPIAISTEKAAASIGEYQKYLEVLPLQVKLEEFLLCHFPYSDIGRHKGRYTKFLPIDEGQWLLHGHVHSKAALEASRPRCYDVGVDSHDFTPVHIDEIRKEINAQP